MLVIASTEESAILKLPCVHAQPGSKETCVSSLAVKVTLEPDVFRSASVREIQSAIPKLELVIVIPDTTELFVIKNARLGSMVPIVSSISAMILMIHQSGMLNAPLENNLRAVTLNVRRVLAVLDADNNVIVKTEPNATR